MVARGGARDRPGEPRGTIGSRHTGCDHRCESRQGTGEVRCRAEAPAPYPNELPRLDALRKALIPIGEPLLVVPFVSETLAPSLTAADWSWADEQGNFDLRAPGLVLRQRRTSTVPKMKRAGLPQGSGSLRDHPRAHPLRRRRGRRCLYNRPGQSGEGVAASSIAGPRAATRSRSRREVRAWSMGAPARGAARPVSRRVPRAGRVGAVPVQPRPTDRGSGRAPPRRARSVNRSWCPPTSVPTCWFRGDVRPS